MGYQQRQYGRRTTRLAASRSESDSAESNNDLVVQHADHLLDGARKLIERYQRERTFIVTLSLALLAGVLGGMAKFLLDGDLRTLLRTQADSMAWFIIALGVFGTIFGVSALGFVLAIRSAFIPYGSMIVRGPAPRSLARDDESATGDDDEDISDELFDDFEVAIQHLELSEDAIDKAAIRLDALGWEIFEARYAAAASMVERMLTLRAEVHAARQVFRWSLYCLATTVVLGLGLLLWLTFEPAQGPKTTPNPSMTNPADADTVSWRIGKTREESCADGEKENNQSTRRCPQTQGYDLAQSDPRKATSPFSLVYEARFAFQGFPGDYNLRAGIAAGGFLSLGDSET